MKLKINILLLLILMISSPLLHANKGDGICTCRYIATKNNQEYQFSSNARRPIICDSCESRCLSLMPRIKDEHHVDKIRLEQFECS